MKKCIVRLNRQFIICYTVFVIYTFGVGPDDT